MSYVSRIAQKLSSIKEYKKEWKKEFYLLMSIKGIISLFSIVTSYLYLYGILYVFTGMFTHFFSGLILLTVEISVSVLLSKFAKHTLRKRFVNTAVLLPLVVLSFGMSFYFSTNGIAQLTTSKVSDIAEISASYKLEKDNIKLKYSEYIIEVKESIQTIKDNPVNWKNGQRSALSKEQLNEISRLNAQIFDLRKDQSEELRITENEFKKLKNEDTATTTATADRYYNIVGFILLLQCVISFVLAYMGIVIYRNDETHEFSMQDIGGHFDRMFANFQRLYAQRTKDFTDHITEEVELETFLAKTKTDEGTPIPPVKEVEPQKKIGFQVSGKNTEKANEPTSEPTSVTGVTCEKSSRELGEKLTNQDVSELPKAKNYGLTNCPNCGKEFAKHAHNHKYCSENCRLEYNEKTKGYNLDRYKV